MSEANNGGRGDRACGRAVGGNPRNPRNPFNPRFRHGWVAERTATLIGLKQNVNRTSFVSLDDGLRLASYSFSTLIRINNAN